MIKFIHKIKKIDQHFVIFMETESFLNKIQTACISYFFFFKTREIELITELRFDLNYFLYYYTTNLAKFRFKLENKNENCI